MGLQAGTMHKNISEGTRGKVQIIHDSPDPLTRLRAARSDQPLLAQKYTRLLIDGRCWMTDAEFECWTNVDVILKATGDVLIAGLGIGLMVLPILEKSCVKSVTVLEINPDVIALVGPQIAHPKLKIIEADCREWTPVAVWKFDCIYLDIWPDVPNSDNREEIVALKRRFRKHLVKGGYIAAWCEYRTKRRST